MCPWWCWSKGPRGPGACRIGRWSGLDHRRLAPARWFPARSRAGIQAFSRESPDAKSRGGCPPPQPQGPARSHSLVLAWWGAAERQYFPLQPVPCPDLGTFFQKNAFQHIFLKCVPKIGLRIPGRNSPTIAPKTRIPKTSEWERAAAVGVRACPSPLSPHFSGEMGTPARQAGPQGAAPRGLVTAPTTRRRNVYYRRFGPPAPCLGVLGAGPRRDTYRQQRPRPRRTSPPRQAWPALPKGRERNHACRQFARGCVGVSPHLPGLPGGVLHPGDHRQERRPVRLPGHPHQLFGEHSAGQYRLHPHRLPKGYLEMACSPW